MGLFSHHNEKSDALPPAPPSAPPPSYPGSSTGQQGFPQSEAVQADSKNDSGPSRGLYNAPPSIFAALLLSRTDRIRIIGFPPNVTPALNEAIQRAWPVGVQQAGPYDQVSYEWKLRGNPCRPLDSSRISRTDR